MKNSNQKQGLTAQNRRLLLSDFVKNKNNDINTLAEKYNVSRSTVALTIENFLIKKTELYIVKSLDLANTFYAINDLLERKFTISCAGFIQERYLFNSAERQYLKTIGFNI